MKEFEQILNLPTLQLSTCSMLGSVLGALVTSCHFIPPTALWVGCCCPNLQMMSSAEKGFRSVHALSPSDLSSRQNVLYCEWDANEIEPSGNRLQLRHVTFRLELNNDSLGFPGWLSGKESACQRRRHGFDPGSGKIPHATKHVGRNY